MRHFQCLVFIVLFLGVPSVSLSEEETQRIVSLAPSNTAMLRDLGVSDRLIGITTFCQRPGDATDAVIIGTLTNPNLELIATLKPTIVYGNREANSPESMDRLEAIGLRVIRLGPSKNLPDIVRDFLQMAECTHRIEFAKTYVQQIERRITQIQEILQNRARKRVFIEIWPKPLMTVSKLGFINNVVELAGGTNLFANTPLAYPQVTIESVLAQKPEVILILTHSLIDESRVQRYREFIDFQEVRIEQTDASNLTQPCLSTFLEAVEYFVRIIHPDLDRQIDQVKRDEQELESHGQ